jgi:hypothetical protein
LESRFEFVDVVEQRRRGAMLRKKEEQAAQKEKRCEQSVSRVQPCQSKTTFEPCCGRRAPGRRGWEKADAGVADYKGQWIRNQVYDDKMDHPNYCRS